MARSLGFAFLLLLVPALAPAQQFRANVTGTVTDAQGAAFFGEDGEDGYQPFDGFRTGLACITVAPRGHFKRDVSGRYVKHATLFEIWMLFIDNSTRCANLVPEMERIFQK